MISRTHLRKMSAHLNEEGLVHYSMPLHANLERQGDLALNVLIDSHLKIQFTGKINCIETGKSIRKTYGEGLCYEAWLSSPVASPSIIHPELSRIHEGIALRDFEWEMKHHNVPHVVYLAYTDKVKVGVTRAIQRTTRWIDQGAARALVFAETPYRQLAGEIEVFLKDYVADKTSWQAMIRCVAADESELLKERERLENIIREDLGMFLSDDSGIIQIHYPITSIPQKLVSVKLERAPTLAGKLIGIKGQYFIFESGEVLNIRAHSGYEVEIEY